MNTYDRAAAAVAAGAAVACLVLAACSAGVTSASSPPSQRASATAHATGHASSPAASASASTPASAGLRTIALQDGPSAFPLPPGAKVVDNMAIAGQASLFFTGVAPAAVASFYQAVLPREGCHFTLNTLSTFNGVTEAEIQFTTSRGVKASVTSLSRFDSGSVAIAGLGHKNVTTVVFGLH